MRHVIIGAGPAGVVAAETLRGLDSQAEILLIGDEPEPPYSANGDSLLFDRHDQRGRNLPAKV